MTTKLVVQTGRAATVVVVSRLLHEFLESNEHAWIRQLFQLRRDVPYVAEVFAESVLPVDPRGFWQLRSLPDAKQFFLDSSGCPTSPWEAKALADQLLLLLGAGQPPKLRWGGLLPGEVEKLEGVGGLMYAMAAEAIGDHFKREDLEAMSLNFRPWTEVLAEFRHPRPLITV